jgi:hypothetical protein
MTGRGKARNGLLVGLIAILGVSTAHAADLISIPQAKWGCELSETKALQGINAGLISRGWIITNRETKGHVVAQILVRNKHTLAIDIDYTATTVDIAYKSSDNLNYAVREDGTIEIHKNANRWMSTIRKDILIQLAALCNF